MLKNTEDKGGNGWELSIGFYPGILIGMRTYYNKEYNEHVFYLPFIDVCILIDK